MRLGLVALPLATLLLACPPPPIGKDACESISIPAIGPAAGSYTFCVLPTDCREDTMAAQMGSAICADKSGGSCPAGNAACSNKCGGTIVSSGLKASGCTWERANDCLTQSGDRGSRCTCAWTIPTGGSVQCGCGCQ
jgi:hypothetical protein